MPVQAVLSSKSLCTELIQSSSTFPFERCLGSKYLSGTQNKSLICHYSSVGIIKSRIRHKILPVTVSKQNLEF